MPADPPYQYGTLARKGGGPQDASYLAFLKGKAALEREEFQLAEVNFAQALHLSPNNAQAMIFLLYAQLKRRPTLRAVEGLQSALKLAPNDPLTLRMAAKVNVMLDQSGEAMALLERARAIDPKDAVIQAELASGYLALRKRSECEAALKEALLLAPDNALALSVKDSFAKVFFDATTIQPSPEQSLRNWPESDVAHTQDGAAAVERGEMAEGYWHLREALRLNPKSYEARQAIIAALRQRFPLYDRFERFAAHAARYRVVTTFVLVFAVARLVALAVSSAAMPIWAAPACLAGAAVLLGFAAALAWPLAIVTFLLRFHPIGRFTLTKLDRAENLLAVLGPLSGIASWILWPIFHANILALSGALDLSLLAEVVASASLCRRPSSRGVNLAVIALAWITFNAIAALFAAGLFGPVP